MFDALFGWRKASKCKKLIKRVRCRIKLLKNKRCSIVRQSREDVALLLRNGHHHTAFDRVEQLVKDESLMTAYDLLDHFCDFILIQLSYIRKHKDLPNDINEAASSLIFASARCGDLPELPVIRKLFGERYGERFAAVALELLPGNLVNRQIRENLSARSVSDDEKYRLMGEIAGSCLHTGPLALEYHPEQPVEQGMENVGDDGDDEILKTDVGIDKYNKVQGSHQVLASIPETEGKISLMDISHERKDFQPESSSQFLRGSDSTATSTHFSTIDLSTSPGSMDSSSMHKKEEKVENYTHLNPPYVIKASGQRARKIASENGPYADPVSSSECSSQMTEQMIYLDDIEELRSSKSQDRGCQDQRLFKFKSSGAVFGRENLEKGSRSSRKSRKGAVKRQRRRSVSWDNGCLKDVEYATYCGESPDDSPHERLESNSQRKYQKKTPLGEGQKSCCDQEMSDLGSGNYEYNQSSLSNNCSFNSEMVHDCSLERPCYSCISDDKDDWEIEKMRTTSFAKIQAYGIGEENFGSGVTKVKEMEKELLPQKPGTKHYQIGKVNGNNLDHSNHLSNKTSMKLEEEAAGFGDPRSKVSSRCFGSMATSPRSRKETQPHNPPYSRAMTMPPERPTDGCHENILRSNSFPLHQTNGSLSCRHIHPKLPDHEQLAATFMALKKANLPGKKC